MARRDEVIPPKSPAEKLSPNKGRRETFTPWQDLFAFLLLVSGSLVVVFVLLATKQYYPSFRTNGRFLAWLVVLGGFAALGSLMVSLLRLYVQPVLQNGRVRRARKRNP